MAEGRTFAQMLKDRLTKQGLYDTPAYWDMKTQAYEGLARSNWPSNRFNFYWDERQMAILDRVLGDVRGLSIADVACGTGRASRHLALRGARVTGLDFSARALEAAERETRSLGLDIAFRSHDVLLPPPSDLLGSFDVAMTISCLAMACPDGSSFERGVRNVASLVRPGGKLLFLEPIHRSRALRRILPMSTREWIMRCESIGLSLQGRGRMGFVPVRLLLAFRDWPEPLVRTLFRGGEKLLDELPALDPLSDYKWLLFERREPAVV